MRTRRARIIVNAAIALLTAVAWLQMYLGWGGEGGRLFAVGVGSLKYFTVLSNIFSGVVSAVAAVRLAHGREVSHGLLGFKLAATTSVALTFAVVAAFLGPLFGWASMYVGANFWFHLMLPLAAMAGFCLLEEGELPRSATLLATVPMLLYGAVYYANILINGVGEWPNRNDFYGFLDGGIDSPLLVFAIIAAATWLLAFALCRLRARAMARTRA